MKEVATVSLERITDGSVLPQNILTGGADKHTRTCVHENTRTCVHANTRTCVHAILVCLYIMYLAKRIPHISLTYMYIHVLMVFTVLNLLHILSTLYTYM